jgi:hypothetical protein
VSEPGKELTFSPAGLEEAEAEPYRVTTGPLEVRQAVAVPEPDEGSSTDWVMLGEQVDGGGIRLVASLELARVRVQRRVDGFSRIPVKPGGPVARVPNVTLVITAEMRNFTSINAVDYPSALRSLMEMWARARPQS